MLKLEGSSKQSEGQEHHHLPRGSLGWMAAGCLRSPEPWKLVLLRISALVDSLQNLLPEGLGCTSVVEYLPKMHETLSSSANTTQTRPGDTCH